MRGYQHHEDWQAALCRFGGAPSVPPPPPLPPAAIPPTMANPQVNKAGNSQRTAAAAGAALEGTLKNEGGAAGLTPQPDQQALKTLG